MNSVARTAGSSARCFIPTPKSVRFARSFCAALAISATGANGHDRFRRWTQARAHADRQQYSLHSRFAGTSHRCAAWPVWTTLFCGALTNAETFFKSLTGKNDQQRDCMLTMYYSQQHNKISAAWTIDTEKIGGKKPEGFRIVKGTNGEALSIAPLAVKGAY